MSLKAYMARQAAKMSGANDEAIEAMKEMDAVILKASKLLKLSLTKQELRIFIDSLDGDLLLLALKDPQEEPKPLKPECQCKNTVSVSVLSGKNKRFKKVVCTQSLRHNGLHESSDYTWDERCAWKKND